MSVTHLATIRDLSPPTLACKALLYGLAITADDSGKAQRSLKMLAIRSGMSKRAVRYNLEKLHALGWLVDDRASKQVLLTLP